MLTEELHMTAVSRLPSPLQTHTHTHIHTHTHTYTHTHTQWFGFYKEGQDKETYSLFDSKIWTQVSSCAKKRYTVAMQT